ncbi:MAG: YbaB/EbfC family nucleoid-associated protein [Holosporales bacterium]|jgi:DNA-binding YbaB/EbfC family protein|nr:YbaB/EbfC family nucleoid-associated protein [Holosporales bacterium]
MNNMQQILARAQKLQAKVSETQKQLEKEIVTGTSGSGMVNITMTVKGNVQSISIDKKVISPEEKELLEDLIIAALNDAKTQADRIYEDGMKDITGGVQIPGLF